MLYINDLASVVPELFAIFFADDSNLFITGKDMSSMCSTLNSSLKKVYEWLCCNKLSLNIKKTHYMIFAPKNRKLDPISIQINNEEIIKVSHTKFLGVIIDDGLNFKLHIEYIRLKMSKSLGILSRARKILMQKTLLDLYYTFIYPYLTYCNEVWGNVNPTTLMPLVL